MAAAEGERVFGELFPILSSTTWGGVGAGPGAEAGPGRIALWIYADDCDAVVARARNAGARIGAEPADQPWGKQLAVVGDPDGNEVYIGQVNPQADGA